MRRVLMLSLPLLAAACAGPSAPDLAAWHDASADVRASVESYRALNASAPTGTQCEERLGAYVAEVRPRLQRMLELSGEMDGCFHEMEHHDAADMESRCLQMEDELTRYASAGCASEEPAMNQLAASEHCSRMLEQLEGTAGRAGTMQQMMGSRMMDAGMMGSGMMGGGSCQP